jgi:hypothetical protein
MSRRFHTVVEWVGNTTELLAMLDSEQDHNRRAVLEAEIEKRRQYGRVRQARTRAARTARTPAQIRQDRTAKHPSGTKVCRGCDRDLPFGEFDDQPRETDGLWTRCKRCRAQRAERAAS